MRSTRSIVVGRANEPAGQETDGEREERPIPKVHQQIGHGRNDGYSTTVNSMRRLRARFSDVSFGAIGFVSP
jgi:hypothetical protein